MNHSKSIRLLFACGLLIAGTTQLLSRFFPIPDLVVGSFLGLGIGIEIIALVKLKKTQNPQILPVMIKGLYETHIEVSSLEKAIVFYGDTLGLELAHTDLERRIAFFWIGKTREYMLGAWEKPLTELSTRHFAFRCDQADILEKSTHWLQERNLKPYNFLKDQTGQPMVFAWMPALAIYFDDPDGNVLEFIAILEGQPHPEWGILRYDEWIPRSK